MGQEGRRMVGYSSPPTLPANHPHRTRAIIAALAQCALLQVPQNLNLSYRLKALPPPDPFLTPCAVGAQARHSEASLTGSASSPDRSSPPSPRPT